MVAFPEYRPASFGNALASGLQMSAAVDEMRDKREQRRRKDEAQQFLEPALAGDQGAFVKLAAADPQSANAVGMMLSRLDTRKQAALKEAADFTTQMGMGILNAPPDQQGSAYVAALTEAKRRGMDTSSWPQQWGPQAQGWVQFNVHKAVPVKEWFDKQQSMPTPMGPAVGGSAPAGGGDPAAAISSIESGGKYDAVGPVADGRGSRAYGKYQIMDFNVGPWTQEVLGKLMTPQEFLANPQAQDAVFKAKFGQYQQKYGPEGAAKAWFAGEGGMNNPGAKDVLGTTVADYGAKFTKAMGGPQASAGAPVQLAGGATPPNAGGQGDSMPGQAPGQMPLPPEVRGVQMPPGARMMGLKGVPVVKDGTVLIQKQDGSLDWVPLPQRKDPGQAGGPFAGTGMDQQAYNIVLQGDPSTPAYAAAYAHLAAPRVQFDAQSGQAITIRPDMGWARPPLGVQATPPAAAPSAAGIPAPSPAPAQPPQSGGVTIERVMDPKKSEAFKKLETDVRAVDAAINRFQSIVDETSVPDRWRAVVNDPTSAQAQKLLGAYNALKTALRSEAFVNTGVLQPAEMKMIDDMLLAPNSIRGGLATPEAYKAMLGEFRQFIEGKIAAGYAVNGITPQGGKATPPAAPAPEEGPADKSKRQFDLKKKYGLE